MVGISAGLGFLFCLPRPLFDTPYSYAMYDTNDNLLGARIAADGQWRFPIASEVPEKYAEALIAFEDRRFYYHPGIDPFSLGTAMVTNIKQGKTVRGGSTIPMQVMRMAGNQPRRSIWNKGKEAIQAVRLHLSYSKKEILALYASHAPFGGNVVGIEAACWRYFGKSPDLITWSEAALLAVLPNSPSLINTGKNRDLLEQKRNKLLQSMLEIRTIDSFEYELALLEFIPEHPLALPMAAPHLLDRAVAENPGEHKVYSTLDPEVQTLSQYVANDHIEVNKQADIQNIGILVLDTRTGKTLAYIGNSDGNAHENRVDMVTASRSSGSILKPLLYGSMISEGRMMPEQLIEDTPIHIQGFSPQNYNRTFSGAIAADEALARSLNVPFVLMLKEYGIPRFLNIMKKMGITTLNKSADHYGLSLILGGGEVNLWEMCSTYASMGRMLINFGENGSKYDVDDFHAARFSQSTEIKDSHRSGFEPAVLSASSIWFTMEAMSKLDRPGDEGLWEVYSSSKKVAWKTGTSFGHRDAWAIGVSPDYTVGVWVGNSDGEARNGIIGSSIAAPVLFDIFNRLPGNRWFRQPLDDMVEMAVCTKSGLPVGMACPDADSLLMPENRMFVVPCSHHIKAFVTEDEQFRVYNSCYPQEKIYAKAYFKLPPSQAYYYKKNYADYVDIPAFLDGCAGEESEKFALIYPGEGTSIYIPKNLSGKNEKTVLQATHTDPAATLYWHLDDQYIGATTEFHSMAVFTTAGRHEVSLVDQQGLAVSRKFEIVNQ